MTPARSDAPYTLRNIEVMLGLRRSVTLGLVKSGFVSPTRGPRNEYRFTFQDVVLLRTAFHLQQARIPARRMLRSLGKLRAGLPPDVPLSGLRIAAIGNDVAVRDGASQWVADSGQLLMDFDARGGGAVAFLQVAPPGGQAGRAADAADAAQWFARGEALDTDEPAAAEQAYRKALELDAGHASAYLNLGALLCEADRCEEALALYDAAVRRCPEASLLHFNRAIALEDLHRESEALKSYERCLALAPELADAHFNAARLYAQQGLTQRALRHYNAYRQLHSA